MNKLKPKVDASTNPAGGAALVAVASNSVPAARTQDCLRRHSFINDLLRCLE